MDLTVVVAVVGLEVDALSFGCRNRLDLKHTHGVCTCSLFPKSCPSMFRSILICLICFRHLTVCFFIIRHLMWMWISIRRCARGVRPRAGKHRIYSSGYQWRWLRCVTPACNWLFKLRRHNLMLMLLLLSYSKQSTMNHVKQH